MYREECIDFIKKFVKSMQPYSNPMIIMYGRFIYIIDINLGYICRIKVFDKVTIESFMTLNENYSTPVELKDMEIPFKNGLLGTLIQINHACESHLNTSVRLSRYEVIDFLNDAYKTPSKLKKVDSVISSTYTKIIINCIPINKKSRSVTSIKEFDIKSNEFIKNRVYYTGITKCNTLALIRVAQNGIKNRYISFEYSDSSFIKIRERKFNKKDVCWLLFSK